MKHSDPDNRASRETDERLDALVEEALREIARPPEVNVKSHVMAEWDEQSLPFRLRRRRTRPWSPPSPLLKPAAALAGALVIVIATFVTWQQADRSLRGGQVTVTDGRDARPTGITPSGSHAGTVTDGRDARPTGITPSGSHAGTVTDGRDARPTGITPSGSRAGTVTEGRDARPAGIAARPAPPLEWPVEELATAEEFGSMPGAPAGELGDAMAPMPWRPAIEIAPIVPAPTIAAMARPVSDFPTDDQLPEPPAADPGNSQGERR